MRKLSDCIEGEIVTIQRIQGPELIRKRLIEMGFLKGKVLEIIRYAPLKDPMEIRIGDGSLTCQAVRAAA